MRTPQESTPMTTEATPTHDPGHRDLAADLSDEYEHEPVPPHARKSLASIAAVWFGFPMNLGNAVFGGVIVYNLGLINGLIAILLGNLVLFGYVGALSYIAGTTGRNFSLQALVTFGTTGRLIAVGFLSTVVIGWFSFQIGLTGTTMEDALGWMPIVGAALAAVLFTGLTTVGIRALSWLGMIATPLFVVLGGIALFYGATGNGLSFNDVVSYEGTGTALTFGAAVGIVIAGFADSGTMTGDFTRWSTSGKSAVVATFTAFPVSNFVAYVCTRRTRRRGRRIQRPSQQRRRIPRPAHRPQRHPDHHRGVLRVREPRQRGRGWSRSEIRRASRYPALHANAYLAGAKVPGSGRSTEER